MGFFPSEAGGPHIDPLLTGGLRSPMLTEMMNSPGMKAEVGAVAHEIMRRYLAHYDATVRKTGNTASTAKVTYHRHRTRYDNRWEAEFTVGGPRAPYVPELEEEYHLLAQALRDMGYLTGDMRAVAPPGRA